MKRAISLFLLVLFMLSWCSAFAVEDRYVDVDAVKAVEEQDNFPVKVVSKEIMYDVGGFSLQGKDACVFNIQNDSEHTVVSLTIQLVGYTEDNKIVNVYVENSFRSQEPGIQILTWSGAEIASGDSTLSAIRCDASTFSGVRVIIADYTDENGTVYENEWAEAWRMAVEPDKATLDLDEVEIIPSVEGDVNIAGLKEIEDKDNSPVRIVERKILLGGLDMNARMQAGILVGDEKDLCSMTIENMSGETITDVEIYYLGYDNYNNAVQSGSFIRQLGVEYTYQVLTADQLNVPSGEKTEVLFPCNWKALAGIRMIVSKYTTEDGTEYSNPFAEEWTAAYKRTKVLD